MALVESVAVDLATRDEEELWGFYLDHPRPGSRWEANAVDLRGWVLGRRAPAVAVEIVHDGHVIRRVPVDVDREDVAAVYAHLPEALRSGFHATLSLAPVAETALDVRAVLKDQSRAPLAKLRLRACWRDAGEGEAPLVSVVIPCFRQAHYLAEAIESALAQTYPHIEILVVDDGSPDNASEVAARYPGIRCVRQDNQGLSAARNTGLRHSNGSFLVFLDSDDRLLPGALASGLACLRSHPEAALAWGRFRFIGSDGSLLYENQGHTIAADHYAAMLRRNVIPMPASVIYRRSLFESLAGFDTSLRIVADYEMYLRTARAFAVYSHAAEVAEYRRHGLGLSADAAGSLREVFRVLRTEWPYVKGKPALEEAYREGLEFWKGLYGDAMARDVRADLQDGRMRSALRGVLNLLRYCPAAFGALLRG